MKTALKLEGFVYIWIIKADFLNHQFKAMIQTKGIFKSLLIEIVSPLCIIMKNGSSYSLNTKGIKPKQNQTFTTCLEFKSNKNALSFGVS